MPFCLRFCLLMPLPFSEDANFSSSTPDSQIRFGFVITLASTLGPEAALVLVALGFRGEMPKAGSLSQLSSVLFSHRASWAPSSSSLLFLSPSPGANICSESWERKQEEGRPQGTSSRFGLAGLPASWPSLSPVSQQVVSSRLFSTHSSSHVTVQDAADILQVRWEWMRWAQQLCAPLSRMLMMVAAC